ncbi:Terminase large subunit, Lambdalikevirus-type [uncultured Caudovirales phage]|uniref:Terminase large subunit, Lambdalikevirus-type n=1 Tax=uncultured Caudovirales phage TaxID=2100421 RepID=A0A6J5MB34_9CAUD|nr:Terminase large subunit, Lambdalikevirus-type [uncultured Caudovirales phage]
MTAENGSIGLTQAQEGVVEPRYGSQTPRIMSPSLDLPSRGPEMIEFCKEIGFPLLPWQELLAIESLKYKPDSRWAHPLVGIMLPRQQGKSTFMALRILFGIYRLGEKMHLATAHKLTTSAEIFFKVGQMIEDSHILQENFSKKYESKGSQEIRFKNGARYLIRAGNSAARGIAGPDVIHIDELREFDTEDVWSSMRFTQMSNKNPQAYFYSNAGHTGSVLLLKFRERGLAAANGADDSIGWFEWSAEPGAPIDDKEAWYQSNPSLGHTVHEDNIKDSLSDREDIFRTEILCQFVSMINPVISEAEWKKCKNDTYKLDKDKDTWMAIDLSPDRKHASLVAGQRIDGDKFMVALLQTWFNPVAIDDKQMANDVAPWVRKFPVNYVAYSKSTAGSVAARLAPAGIPVYEINAQDYQQSCDEFVSAVSSARIVHEGQEELDKQVLSAVKLQRGDGGWVMGRKASGIICGAVGAAMVTHFATRAETEVDILIG